jgi:thymidine phosphorylase
VHDIAEHRYSKIELTAFVVATNRDELDREEVYFLTEAMIAAGRKAGLARKPGGGQTLHWRHSRQPHLHAGGAHRGRARHAVPQNIVARHHLPAGTADTMEVLANVELPSTSCRTSCGAPWLPGLGWHGPFVTSRRCADFGGAAAVAGFAGADGGLHPVKKISAGSSHLVLDIPIGPTAKVRSMPEAQRLRRIV